MKTIPDRFTKNGWFYKLVERTPLGAIYSQSKHPDLPPNGVAAAYEVMHVRVREGRTIKTRTVDWDIQGGEYLPSTEEWGTHGWTCSDLPRARYRLAEISTIFGTPRAKAGIPATT
jgi:hypothetical protein